MDWTNIVSKIVESQLVPFGIILYLLFPFIIIIGGGYLLWKIAAAFGQLDLHIQECNGNQKAGTELMKELKPFIQETNRKQDKTLEIVTAMQNRM